MKGQWIGNCEGTNNGLVFVNVDELANCYRGLAYLSQAGAFGTVIGFQTPNKNKVFEIKTRNISAINPKTGLIEDINSVELNNEGVQFPREVKLNGNWNDKHLSVNWKSDIGSIGTCTLTPSQASQPSKINSQKMSWKEFKNHIEGYKNGSFLFRGQNKPYRLRTSFHRTGRADIYRYINEDIPALKRATSSKTKHQFNLQNAEENGAFFALLQHHGYPTPLLDWTYSPYVASFFAFRGNTVSNNVRIYILNGKLLAEKTFQSKILVPGFLFITTDEYLAIENERITPQQSAFTLTNIDDIETFISVVETNQAVKILEAVDIPISEKSLVIKDLRYMGITAGSMFPGLDGICEEQKERYFG